MSADSFLVWTEKWFAHPSPQPLSLEQLASHALSLLALHWPGPGGQHRGGRALLEVPSSRSTAAVRRCSTGNLGAAMQAHSSCCVDPATLEPWLPGCRVLPGRVAGLPGCCRVSAGLPGAAGCRGAAGCCRVLPGAAGCCRVLPGCEDVCPLSGAAGCCRVLPGCRVAGCCRVAGLPGCAVGALVGLCPSCRVAHVTMRLSSFREQSLS